MEKSVLTYERKFRYFEDIIILGFVRYHDRVVRLYTQVFRVKLDLTNETKSRPL